jgi:hypothetical protein
VYAFLFSLFVLHALNITLWPESASELYRPRPAHLMFLHVIILFIFGK